MKQLSWLCGIAALAGCAVNDDAETATATAASFAFTPMGFARVTAAGGVVQAPTDGGVVTAIAFNSTHGAVTPSRTGLGTYDVGFAGLAAPSLSPGQGGNVQVTAEGAGNVRCRITSWGGAPTLVAHVRCSLPSDAAADSGFAVLVFRNPQPAPNSFATSAAYTWVDSLGATYATYDYNSSGQHNTATRIAGLTKIHVPGATSVNASMMVTAYGGTAVCGVAGWGAGGGALDATIDCRDAANNLVDSAFSFSYSVTGPAASQQGGHAWFDSARAHPAYSSALGKITGCSTATITGTPGGALSTLTVAGDLGPFDSSPLLRASFASSYAIGGYCKIEALTVSGSAPTSSATTTVRCYDATGAVITSGPWFTFTHVTSEASGPC